MDKNSKICIVGHNGMLGHAIWEKLSLAGYKNIIGCSRPDVDLCDQKATQMFFEQNKPEYVFFLAAVAAGIQYKKDHPVEMLVKNLQIITNLMESAYAYGCKRMINVCSALIYPSQAEIPLQESDATYVNLNEIDTPYSLAKAAGMQLANYYNQQYKTKYITVVPCNFFGAFAPFEGDRAGVVPSLIRRIHEAKIMGKDAVEVWGTGNACREFLNSKDVADACVFLMNNDKITGGIINIGRGYEFSIKEVAYKVKEVVGYNGELVFDSSKPEGRAHMQLNTEKLFKLGWRPTMDLKDSLIDAYEWYLKFKKEERP